MHRWLNPRCCLGLCGKHQAACLLPGAPTDALDHELPSHMQRRSGHCSEIAALKREVRVLSSQLKAIQRQARATDAPKAQAVTKAATPKKSRQIQFDAQALIEKRAALGLTQKQMAQLLGASSLSVYKWEKGHVHPRAAQLNRIVEVLKLGKRKALALLNP